MEFRILGPLDVVENGTSLPLGGPRQRALLALLLLRANEPVSTDRLIDELWGADSPASGPTAVQNQIARLRKVLGADRVLTTQAGYAIRVEADELDLDRYGQLVATADAAPPEERSALLAEAVGLWRGPALAGLPDAPFVAPESARLEGLRLAALEDRIDADLELGRHGDLVAELSSLAARYPLQERLRGQLMVALYRSGRQAEALDVYRETRRLLADELGLEPSQSLRELERAILAQDPSLDAPPRSAKPPRPAVVPVASPTPRRGFRIAAAVTAVALLAAAGAFTAYALNREPGTKLAAPGTTPSTGSSPEATPPTTSAGTTTRKHDTTTTPTTTSPVATTLSSTTTAPTTRPETVTTTPRPPPTTTAPTQMAVPVTTTPKPKPKPEPKPQPKLLRIEDDFSAPSIDLAIWRPLTDGTGADVTEQGGQVVVALAADGFPGGPDNALGARVGTQCTFPGDFDARVDFTLFDWPASNNVRAGLNAYFADGFVGRRWTSSSGNEYAGRVGSRNGTVQLDETAGSLRIARVGTTMTTYFWRNGHWVPLATGTSSGAAVLGLEVTSGSDFGHQTARVAFDNFAVTAKNMFCPAGSAPPGA